MESTCFIQTPTPNLQQSQAFYGQIGFVPVDDSRLIWTDGKAHIEINPDRFARAGIKLFKSNWGKEVGNLQLITKVIAVGDGYVFADPSGTWTYLIEKEPPIQIGRHGDSIGMIGNFQGLSLETVDIEKSVSILETLGFEHSGGNKDQGYVVYNIGDFSVSLMKPLSCPHLFFNPSLTYFNNKNNLSIIAKLREIGVPFSEEITIFNKEGLVDNVIIRDPGGIGFFIFSD
jgi:hypothetical protein